MWLEQLSKLGASMSSELISHALRFDFREFCVNHLVLRQINDCFMSAGVKKGSLPSDRIVSGQRRTLVEEYYSTLNWIHAGDVKKFLDAIQLALSQSYLQDGPRKQLIEVLKREGYVFEGLQIRKITQTNVAPSTTVNDGKLLDLAERWIKLVDQEPQKRGFSFELLLNEIFNAFELAPKKSFRLLGEQIDGSFQLGGDTYLVEAKWQNQQTSQADLLIFREKVESKSAWARGVFISHSGFSRDGLNAFSRGRSTNIVGMDGQDLYFVLTGKITLIEAVSKKVRRAAETGEFFVPLFELLFE